ncbi:MAG TPA: fumarylacetoacetate hydrolase family protein, partial [Candidatus Baltobacteraceae bacterium]|nr:fumarylacetoacetate hydrolase family protein [Candidatus Baltobacteraceae bacterium]
MKIVRYLDPAGKIFHGAELPTGETLRMEGDIFSRFEPTRDRAQIKKILAPVVPAAIFCIGLNYKHHAAESNLPTPQFPVLFMKNPGALQHPGDP